MHKARAHKPTQSDDTLAEISSTDYNGVHAHVTQGSVKTYKEPESIRPINDSYCLHDLNENVLSVTNLNSTGSRKNKRIAKKPVVSSAKRAMFIVTYLAVVQYVKRQQVCPHIKTNIIVRSYLPTMQRLINRIMPYSVLQTTILFAEVLGYVIKKTQVHKMLNQK